MTTRYRLAADVRWIVNRFTVTVSDGRGEARTLEYPQAAVWDLFSRGYAYDKVVSMVTHIASLEAAEAEAMVRASIQEWAQQGLVERIDTRMIEMRPV